MRISASEGERMAQREPSPVVDGTSACCDAHVVLRLSVGARSPRRELGPVACSVLEDVALASEPDQAGVLVARISVRSVATHLGIGKDRAAAALRRLCGAGLLVCRESERGTSGTFGRALYELRLAGVDGVAVERQGERARSHRRNAADQPSLFEANERPW